MRNVVAEMAEKLGEKGKEYFSLGNERQFNFDFAQKSSLHGELMKDGYIFNPYIHRRFLPAQYMKMKNLCGLRIGSLSPYNSPYDMIDGKYTSTYCIKYTLEEIYKLALLEEGRSSAFQERKLFFTVERVKDILLKYLSEYEDNIKYVKPTHSPYIYVYGVNGNYFVANNKDLVLSSQSIDPVSKRMVNVYTLEPTFEMISTLVLKIEKAQTYGELRRHIKKCPLFDEFLYEKCSITSTFKDAFALSGAYYTLKHKIMFERGSFESETGSEACRLLRKRLEEGWTWEQFDSCI